MPSMEPRIVTDVTAPEGERVLRSGTGAIAHAPPLAPEVDKELRRALDESVIGHVAELRQRLDDEGW